MSKKNSSSITINAKDPLPSQVTKSINEQRPPPKNFCPNRNQMGYTDSHILKMMKQKHKYQKDYERYEMEKEISEFEKRLGIPKPSKVPLPPVKPQYDEDILESFEIPAGSQYYDQIVGRVRSHTSLSGTGNHSVKTLKKKTTHGRGCPCCDPEGYEIARPRTQSTLSRSPFHFNYSENSYTNQSEIYSPRRNHQLPIQIGTVAWDALDDPCQLSKPPTVFKEHKKPSQFSMIRTGPRPDGIPLVVNDLVSMRMCAQAKFDHEMQVKIKKEKQERKKVLKERAEASRAFTTLRKEHTSEIACLSGQTWLCGGLSSKQIHRITHPIKHERPLTEDEKESLNDLNVFDEKMYREYQNKKKPDNEMERLLFESGFLKVN